MVVMPTSDDYFDYVNVASNDYYMYEGINIL